MDEGAASIHVDVVVAIRASAWTTRLQLPTGATVALAIEHLLRSRDCPQEAIDAARAGRVGVYGRRVDERCVLGEADRLELYRPLVADPKEARRRRAARSG
ncbi:MAG: RnfH family protein [Xanthomonadaceae bacterium]|nr:RnfH family protein [Xanthomonadaceae bacterium]MDE1964414.1 RnfH family protein [Xanthomonadaceae bacterium]